MQGEPFRGGEQRFRPDDFVHDPGSQRLLRREGLAGDDHGQGLGQPDEARQADRAAPARQDAELDFRQPDRDRRVIRRHARLARQCQLESAAKAVSVDRRCRWHRQWRDPLEQRLTIGQERRHLLLCHLPNREQVRAGDEGAALCRRENDAARRVLLDRADYLGQLGEHLRRHRIDALLRKIEPDGEDLVGINRSS